MNKYELNNYKRISKKAAERAYYDGVTIILTPYKMNPENEFFNLNAAININNCDTFENAVNAFTFYNCNNETGKYPAYYIKRFNAYERAAHEFVEALKAFTPEQLENFESYLSQHFPVWIAQYANTPAGIVEEFKMFASM